jgi:hypothetical protein
MAALVAVFEPGLIRAEINSAGATAPPCPLARDQAARLRSCEEARPNAAQGARPAATWRLVRASNPRGGPDAVSIMQTADAAHSDLDLVRLRLRCSDTGFDVLVVFRKPFPPRAHPKVKATVISPGAAVSLPAEAAMLVKGSWQSSSELAIEVEGRKPCGAGRHFARRARACAFVSHVKLAILISAPSGSSVQPSRARRRGSQILAAISGATCELARVATCLENSKP